MKKAFCLAAALVISSFASFNAAAVESEGSDGTRGGAEFLFVDGEYKLRDLVDPSVCQNKTGWQFRKETPELDQILARLAKLDWYFAAGLKYEIDRLQICLTEEVKKLPGDDWDRHVSNPPQRVFQGAIRFLDSRDVLLSRNKLPKTSESTRSYTLIHEAMHGFISRYVPLRKAKVWGAVKAVADVSSGIIRRPEQLHAELEHNRVEYPWSSRELQHSRKAIEFALKTLEDQADAFLADQDLNSLLSVSTPNVFQFVHYLQVADLAKNPADRTADLLRLSDKNLVVLNHLLNPGASSKPLLSFDPLMVAFSVADALGDAQFENLILQSSAMKAGPRLFARMTSKTVAIHALRIHGLNGYSLLGITEAPESDLGVPALSVRPFTLEEAGRGNPEVWGLIHLIGSYLKEGDERGWSVVRSMVTQNDSFYDAFGIKHLQQDLEGLISPVAREKNAVAEALPELVRGFRMVLKDHVTRKAGAGTAEKLDQEIRWDRLGLTN